MQLNIQYVVDLFRRSYVLIKRFITVLCLSFPEFQYHQKS